MRKKEMVLKKCKTCKHCKISYLEEESVSLVSLALKTCSASNLSLTQTKT